MGAGLPGQRWSRGWRGETLGHVAFGTLWPAVAWSCAVGLAVLALVGTGYGPHSIATALEVIVYRPLVWLLTPIWWLVGWCPSCKLRGGGEVAPADPTVPLQRGPGTSTPVTNYYFATMRGKDERGKAYHVIIRVGDTAARLDRPAHGSGHKG